MSNRMRTIKSLPLIAVLFTCVVILSSAAIFASEESTPSSEVSSWLAPDLDSVQAKAVSEEIFDKLDSGTRASMTIDDVYWLLYYGMRGESYSSDYSLPRIASYTDRIAQTLYGSGQSVPTVSLYSRVTSINSNISDLFHAIVDGNSTNIPVGPGIRQMLYGIDSQGNWETTFDVTQDSRDLLQLIYAVSNQIHGDGQNSTYYLSTLNQTVSSIDSKIDSGFEWRSVPITYFQTRVDGVNGSSASSGWYDHLAFGFYPGNSVNLNTPAVFRAYFPWESSADHATFPGLSDLNVSVYVNNQMLADVPPSDYYVESAPGGFFIYFFNISFKSADSIYFFDITTPPGYYYNSSSAFTLSSIDFNTDEYQQLKQAFYQVKTAESVSALSNYLVSPEKQAAEQASQQVIDDTLDGFTGSGSAAAKGSDIGSMKNISGSVQNGLDTGGSAGDAASVFTNSNFWSWFTQSTSDGINNAYPAPVVEQRRGSGDEIPDFISGDHDELENYRNRRDRW